MSATPKMPKRPQKMDQLIMSPFIKDQLLFSLQSLYSLGSETSGKIMSVKSLAIFSIMLKKRKDDVL